MAAHSRALKHRRAVELVANWRNYLLRDDLTARERTRAEEQLAWAEQNERSTLVAELDVFGENIRRGKGRHRA